MEPMGARSVLSDAGPHDNIAASQVLPYFRRSRRQSLPLRKYLVPITSVALTVGCSDARSVGELPPGKDSASTIQLDTIARVTNDVFFRITRVRLLGDGFVVANGGSIQILRVDQDGTVQAPIGRQGDGPGEFLAVTDAVALGDSLLVLDALLRRIQLFIGSEPMKTYSLANVGGTPEALFLSSIGEVIVAVRLRARPEGTLDALTVLRDSIQFLVAGTGSVDEWTSLFKIPGAEYLYGPMASGGTWVAVPPFGTGARYEMTEPGVIVADGRTGRVHILDWAGGERIIYDALPEGDNSVPEDQLELWRAEIENRANRLSDPAAYRQRALASLNVWGERVPQPVFEDLVGSEDMILVRLYEFGQGVNNSWLAFEPNGTLLGELIVPQNVRIADAARGFLAAVVQDSMGVESLMLLRLLREP